MATAAAAMVRWSRCHHAAALAGKAARQQRSLAVREVKIVAGSGAPACCAVGIPSRDELFQLALESGGAGAGGASSPVDDDDGAGAASSWCDHSFTRSGSVGAMPAALAIAFQLRFAVRAERACTI